MVAAKDKVGWWDSVVPWLRKALAAIGTFSDAVWAPPADGKGADKPRSDPDVPPVLSDVPPGWGGKKKKKDRDKEPTLDDILPVPPGW